MRKRVIDSLLPDRGKYRDDFVDTRAVDSGAAARQLCGNRSGVER